MEYQYNRPDFHPRNPPNRRLAVVNDFAKSWKPEDRKGALIYVQRKIPTEVDFTLGYVVNEGKKLGMPMPLCSKVLEIFREIEAAKRQFGQHNYNELVATGK
jgi:3-hydroxyisobutyrate dehydrogenase-like beta-hydroxyacid dehydrogenase